MYLVLLSDHTITESIDVVVLVLYKETAEYSYATLDVHCLDKGFVCSLSIYQSKLFQVLTDFSSIPIQPYATRPPNLPEISNCILVMPTTKKPNHCPGKKTQQLRGNCNVHAGFCKAHHVRCTVAEDYDVFFLYTEKCPICDGGQ